MSPIQKSLKTGQDRYHSNARRVIIGEYRPLENISSHSNPSNDERELTLTPYTDACYPDFPVLIQSNGELWEIGNLYLTNKLERSPNYESRTFKGIADHLLDYLRFLEDEKLDYLHFPKNDRLKVTYRFRQRLLSLVISANLSASTASARINAIIKFYKEIASWGLIDKQKIDNIAFLPVKKHLRTTTSYGGERNLNIESHNLTIPATRKQHNSEIIKDGGSLRPLTIDQQQLMLHALLDSSREYQLMFYLALFTGARLQTVCTIRLKHLDGAVDSHGDLRLPVGFGTLVDTKHNKQITLIIPGWLVEDMRIYSRCQEAQKRRGRSFYGDTHENYLFLSKNGLPYYTSKKEILDRSNHKPQKTPKSVKLQDGAALRTHIKQIILPKIRSTHSNFQSFTFHDLRATFGMNLLESQIKLLGEHLATECIDYVQQRMGHTNKTTTIQYLNYKSRLNWKNRIQHEFEESLFKHINTSSKKGV